MTELTKFLQVRAWIVRTMHASALLDGFPDLYCTHAKFRSRWVEVKLPGMDQSSFTRAQREWFPKMSANGSPIWILTGANEQEYRKLFGPENWFEYFLLKGR